MGSSARKRAFRTQWQQGTTLQITMSALALGPCSTSEPLTPADAQTRELSTFLVYNMRRKVRPQEVIA